MSNPNPNNRPDGIIPEFTLGDRLRKAREIAGMEMRDLAEATGVHRQSVARYEQGAAVPRKPVILSWSLATGCDLQWITSGEISTHVEETEGSTV